MKKLTTVALAAMLSLSLVACGGDDDGGPATVDSGPTIDGGPTPDAPAAGAPVLTKIRAFSAPLGEGPLVLEVVGTDAEGDALQINISFLDGTGALVDLDGEGTTLIPFDPDFAFGADTSFTRRIKLSVSADFIAAVSQARLSIVDAAGNVSNSLDTEVLTNATFNNVGGTCDDGTAVCGGQLTCNAGTCELQAGAAAACTAADAAEAIGDGETLTIDDTIDAVIGSFEGSCSFSSSKNELVRRIVLTAESRVQVQTTTPENLDSYIHIRSECDDFLSEVACNDDINADAGDFRSALDVVLPAGTYYLFIDGSSEAADGSLVCTGAVTFTVTTSALIAGGEACNPETDRCVSGFICHDPEGGTDGTCLTPAEIVAPLCTAAPTLVSGVAVTDGLPLAGSGVFEGSCGIRTGFAEDIYKINLAVRSQVTVTTEFEATVLDTLVYIMEGCALDTEVDGACDDDGGETPALSSIVVVNLDAGDYTVVVDRGFPPDGDPDPTPYRVLYTAKPVIADGGVCDPTEVLNVCDTGLTCTAGTCQ